MSRTLRRVFDRARNQAMGFLAEAPRQQRFEGDHHTFEKTTGGVGEIVEREATTTIAIEEMNPPRTWEELVSKVVAAGSDLGRQIATQTFSDMSQQLREAGRSFDAEGPLSAEVYLHMLERMELDFDDDGNAKLPTLVLPPNVFEKLKSDAELDRIGPDGDLENELERIVATKHGAWRVREADRKLVP